MENFAQNAASEFASTMDLVESKVQSTGTVSVRTTVSFSEDNVTAAQAKTIIVAVVRLPEAEVSVAEKSRRRLREARRLVKAFEVDMTVTTTTQAKIVAKAVTNSSRIVKEANGRDIMIATPTVTAPTLVVDITYTIMQDTGEETVVPPTASQLSVLGSPIGATGTITRTQTQVVPDTSTAGSGGTNDDLKLSGTHGMYSMACGLLTWIVLAHI